uniref:microspherule protein 1 isoform X4 n=1 Tax=Myxine glutinosa TaxID=7769 RepID=UPI00358F3C58
MSDAADLGLGLAQASLLHSQEHEPSKESSPAVIQAMADACSIQDCNMTTSGSTSPCGLSAEQQGLAPRMAESSPAPTASPGIVLPLATSSLGLSTMKLLSQPVITGKRPVSQTLTLVPKRRSSSRSIKRKKFDDELVESSLVKTSSRIKAPGSTGGEPGRVISPGAEATFVEKRKVSKGSSVKRVKKSKQTSQVTKDLGRWKPTDDLLLINGVLQDRRYRWERDLTSSDEDSEDVSDSSPGTDGTELSSSESRSGSASHSDSSIETNDLTTVYLGVKFSCSFSLQEVQDRWYSLLYDPLISKMACQAMRELHPDAVAATQGKSLFSKDEERLLVKIPSSSQPTVEVFQDLLVKEAQTFHAYRTVKVLQTHWQLMKQYHLLDDQTVQQLPKGDQVMNFSDAEDLMNDDELRDSRDEVLENELAAADRRQKREIRQLEQELPRWQAMVESVTGSSTPEFDSQIDVDLSLEGPAWKISRKQGVVKLRSSGEFIISNEGRRPIYIDGKPILTGSKWKLNNNSVVEISSLRFIFLINHEVIAFFRETTHMAQ